ncbi:MAG TPA: ABC transporter substrate-binding protein [Candidatus Binataceae bacterium]|nr:ABC transporter substrate-binding protein [Candidatus Binataceae bacterium]
MRRAVMAATGAALLLAALATEGATAATVWRHGILDAKSDAGITMMVTHGFAAKQGLDLKLLQFKNEVTELQALLSGSLDSYDGGAALVMTAAVRGADVKIIGCAWPGLPHVIFARSGIRRVEDLKGKTIAVSAPGSLPETLARAVLEQHHLTLADVHFASLGNDLDRYKAVATGVADAGVVSREYEPLASKSGLHILVSAQEAMPNYIRLCMVTTGANIAKRGSDVARFLAAEMAGLRYALANRDAALALTRKEAHIGASDPRPAYIYDWAVKTHAVDPQLRIPMDKLAWMDKQLVEIGKLKEPVPLAKFVDEGPRRAAEKLRAAAR